MSVYLSVAPPDGFTRWGDPDWDRWLREHPWEAAERVCSRGDWAIFLYQVRQHAERREEADRAAPGAAGQRAAAEHGAGPDLKAALLAAREELAEKPASLLADAARPRPSPAPTRSSP